MVLTVKMVQMVHLGLMDHGPQGPAGNDGAEVKMEQMVHLGLKDQGHKDLPEMMGLTAKMEQMVQLEPRTTRATRTCWK